MEADFTFRHERAIMEGGGPVILIDRPLWLGHGPRSRGRYWSHLVSDLSEAELHAFAEQLGIPRRGFDRDHYDVPAERFDEAVELGATVVTSREIVRRLVAAGLRRPRPAAR